MKENVRGSADVRQSLFICIGGLEFLRNIKDCVNANLSLLNTGKEIILYDKLTTSNKHKSLEEWAMEFNGDLMLDGEYDWGELVGREKI
ncbi:MAG: hypothetical protein V8S21_07035 [Lachnospira eligens]